MLPFRPVRVLAAALLVALPGALLPAGSAQAADRTVRGGRLVWGIKSSFQSYVTGPIANGSWSLTGGAATVGGSQFQFHSATGSYDPDSGTLRAGFSGGVHFLGHRKTDGSYELDLTISRPTVRISGGAGTLYADMTSKAKGSGRVSTAAQVPLATLGTAGINMRGGSTPVTLNNLPARLTAQGATAFAGYYTAGTALDPVSLSVDTLTPAKPAPATTSAPEPGTPKARAPKKHTTGAFRTAAVDWGVRRTYREYVTGPIAKGKWTLSGGAQDGGALFRFPRGKGSYDPAGHTLDAAFAGSVRFQGTGLDLTLTKVTVRVKDGTGTLSANAVPLVTFPAEDITAKKGLVSLDEAPTKLTSRGAKVFGSLYEAGTAMDPLSLAVAVDTKAQLPALPDLGSDTTLAASAAPSASPQATTGPTEQPAEAASSSPSVGAGTYAAIGAGVLVLAALGVYVAIRRRTAR
ncbi:HtaA domain-containing protein [Streptomyces sp. NBC_00370]|uniref:HtaA domain-containing protein n=1 Tax=Streptomyces sp. NBC_00370 TaxID=2975728 RepID=UPI002E269522